MEVELRLLLLTLLVSPPLSFPQIPAFQRKKSAGYRPNGTWNNEMGYGLVDAKAAVLKALNMSLSGLDMLCPGDGSFTYSISNVPSNAIVTWTCSGGISLSGSNTGTSCFVKGTTPGYAHIKAVVNINGTTVDFGKNLDYLECHPYRKRQFLSKLDDRSCRRLLVDTQRQL